MPARVIVAAAALSALSFATPQSTSTLDYPQWRGQHRDASASAFVEPKVWPDTLTRRWKVDVGEGYATPIVVGDSVYVFTRRGGDEAIAALDAASGRRRWETTYAAMYTPAPAAAAHGAGPKATPLFLDGRLYKAGGLVFILKDDGELIVARASRTAFEPLKTYTVADSATWAQPVISGNRIFIKDASSVALWTIDQGT